MKIPSSKYNMNYFSCLCLMVFVLFQVSGQNLPTDTIHSKIVIRHRMIEGRVLLRWGATDKISWQSGIDHGYILERHTIERDGKPVLGGEVEILSGGPIKPKPLLEWRGMVESNDVAAITAQAIYGESFNTNSNDDNLLMQVINESEELDQRFAFSMFAVDQDFEVAQHAGMGYVDTNIKTNEKYLYNIKLANASENLKGRYNGVLVDPIEVHKLPQPFDFAGYYYNKAFVLIWEYDSLLDYYTSYDLERSNDGKTFKKINDAPITKLAVTKVSGISYTDSIQEYGKKFWYRVRGRTLFDETGPPSDTTSVIAFEELLAVPQFTSNNIISEKEVELQWDFPKDEAWKLTQFDVLRAPKAIGPYKAVATALDKQVRSFKYSEPETINYFKVRAYGIAGDYQDSSPAMIQPVDSIPPDKPIGLQGTVDTLGVVQLVWEPNTEMDLKGYTVLRADRKNQEFTRLTKREVRETHFQDTVNTKTFTSKVYYQIVASDLRYNESEPSDTLVLERPSRVPPTSPVFTAYELLGDTILLKWTPSSSDKIAKQIIYRKQLGLQDGIWQPILETEETSLTAFKDLEIEPNTRYGYTITAINTVGLESRPSPLVAIATPQTLLKPKIKALHAEVDRESKHIILTWRYNEPNVLEIQLYKKENNGEYTLYKTFSPRTSEFLDSKLIPNSKYEYGLKAVFVDGSISEWSEIEVTY
ncbi:hypothetical protein GUA46_09080 [Muricauda sp. HICW]|uniref:Fibronectin type-III domain-containing protein n=1 Tax=Flagellimonas chongwuensis TaxID=2697365 RepID=A0A850NEN3_9FLAO|nr:hypothetical protein [Allomuricauda chongwuensis]NVN18494.1 hypothetical protein [Allomuricauda chongwuensis]